MCDVTCKVFQLFLCREFRPKKNASFHKDGEEISYIQPKSYVFVADRSNGSPDDVVTVINFPILVRDVNCGSYH